MINTFSRRAFLKGITALAAASAIPVEVIAQAEAFIETVKETPITRHAPAFYLRINGLLVPVKAASLDIGFREPPIIYGRGADGKLQGVRAHLEGLEYNPSSTLEFETYHLLPFEGQGVTWEILTDKYPIEFKGEGGLTLDAIEGLVQSDETETIYTYSIFGELTSPKRGQGECV